MNRRTFLHAAALGLGGLVLPPAPPPLPAVLPPEAARAQSLVWVGLDGAGLNTVAPLLHQGLLPALAPLAAVGGPFHLAPGGHPTLTQPAWMAEITGCTGEVHGVNGNYRFDPARPPANPVEYQRWLLQVYWGWTVFKPLRAAGVKIGWFVSKRYLHLGYSFHQVAAQADACSLRYPDDYDPWEDYLPDLVADARAWVADRAAQGGRFLCFLHLNPDKWGHAFGEDSPEYRGEICRVAAALAPLWEQLAELNAAGLQVARLVTSDHGFNPGAKNHDNAPDALLLADFPLRINSGLLTRDVAPTVAGLLGLPPGSLHPKCYGRDLR